MVSAPAGESMTSTVTPLKYDSAPSDATKSARVTNWGSFGPVNKLINSPTIGSEKKYGTQNVHL